MSDIKYRSIFVSFVVVILLIITSFSAIPNTNATRQLNSNDVKFSVSLSKTLVSDTIYHQEQLQPDNI